MPDLMEQAFNCALEHDKLCIEEHRRRKTSIIQKEDISDDTIRYCDECGERIPIKRLKAMPDTIYCIKCKTFLESMQ